LENLQKVLTYCKRESASRRIEKIICCGDLASLETLDFLNDNFSGEIYFVFGNMDDDHLRDYPFEKKYKNTFVFKNIGEIKIENKSIAFTHYPEEAKKLAQTGKYNFVFHGHTHKPWTEKINNCIVLNPGNVANQIYPPTFAVWNTENDNFELIRINDLK
jgi:hypothetical protein